MCIRDREDCCIVLHEKDTLGEINSLACDIVSEYETKAAMYMFAVQSRIQSLLVAIARKSEKINVQKRGKHADTGLLFYHILEYIDMHSSDPVSYTHLLG